LTRPHFSPGCSDRRRRHRPQRNWPRRRRGALAPAAGGGIFSFGNNALLVYSKLAAYTSLSLQWRPKLAFAFRMRDCSNWPA